MTDSDSAPDSGSNSEAASESAGGMEVLRKTAALARLELTDLELSKLAPQFTAILAAFEVLEQLDVEGVPPTLGATDLEDVKRADVARACELSEALLAGAPDRRESHFGVPKTIETQAKRGPA